MVTRNFGITCGGLLTFRRAPPERCPALSMSQTWFWEVLARCVMAANDDHINKRTLRIYKLQRRLRAHSLCDILEGKERTLCKRLRQNSQLCMHAKKQIPRLGKRSPANVGTKSFEEEPGKKLRDPFVSGARMPRSRTLGFKGDRASPETQRANVDVLTTAVPSI